jgi:ParB family chromosome partitioning protein
MQRSDLTLYEEAKGFQMMLDLGKSVKEVSEISGFSETTVRSRVKLTELDEAKFNKAVNRGATLFDFAKIAEIEDPEIKNQLLDKAGTANFANELAQAKDKQKWAKTEAQWLDQISSWATKVDSLQWRAGTKIATASVGEIPVQYVRSYSRYNYKEENIPTPSDESKYYYFQAFERSDIDIYRELDETVMEERTAEENRRNEQAAKYEIKRKAFQEMSERHRKLRADFIRGFGKFSIKNTDVWEFVTEAMLTSKLKPTYGYGDRSEEINTLSELLGVSCSKNSDGLNELDYHEFLSLKRTNPERVALLTAYWIMDRGSYYKASWASKEAGYMFEPLENEDLDKLYRLLSALGYSISTEEQEFRSGTHKLFDKAEQ